VAKLPRISLIAAMGHGRVIGIENRLPWKLPADMKWFRQHTLGKPIIMGRKTFESFGARPLPERHNIVISHNPDYRAAGASVVSSIDEAIAVAGDVPELMIIGGASFYAQMLPRADRLYLTLVDIDVPGGDAWFPAYPVEDWELREEHYQGPDEKNPYGMHFQVLDRRLHVDIK
jgi:dihydrofolate reductase